MLLKKVFHIDKNKVIMHQKKIFPKVINFFPNGASYKLTQIFTALPYKRQISKIKRSSPGSIQNCVDELIC